MTEDRTFIISTHQVRDMENLIDPIIIIHQGKVVFDSELATVSERLVMEIERYESENSATLFSERVPGGWMSVRIRLRDEIETQVDLETLFNAVISNPRVISEALRAEGGQS